MTSTIRAIHAGFRQLGIVEDADRRAIYARVTGKTSSTLMQPAEQEAVVTELRRLGFRKSVERRADGRQKLTGKVAKKLQALWIAGWNLGVVHDRDDGAMLAFVQRQTKVDHTRFLHHQADSSAAIDGLKGWLRRETGVEFGNTNGQEWLTPDGAKVAWAQWRLLTPGADLISRKGFDAAVYAIIGERVWLGDVKAKEWQAVMNELGVRVRAARKALGP